jgi:hypothetical protein
VSTNVSEEHIASIFRAEEYAEQETSTKASGKHLACKSIVTNVYAPWALEELKNYLKCVNFVTMSNDTSNHKHVKQLSILERYFQAYDLENPVKNKLLTFVEISGETADITSVQVMKQLLIMIYRQR